MDAPYSRELSQLGIFKVECGSESKYEKQIRCVRFLESRCNWNLWFVKSSDSLWDKSQRVQRATNTIETDIRKHVNKVSWYIKSLLLMLHLLLMDVPYQKRGICCVKSQLLARHDVKGGKQTAGLRPQKAEICSFKSSWRTRWSQKST